MKKTIFFCFSLLFIALSVGARELKVEAFEAMPNDITARTNAVNDLNGNKCALIKVALPVAGCDFKGNVLKQEFQVNEYYIYMSGGTKDLQVRCPGVESLMVDLRPYTDGKGLESGMTYYLHLSGYEDGSTGSQTQKNTVQGNYVMLDITPKTGVVEIDGNKKETDNGKLVTFLILGPHEISIKAPGYAPYSETITITAQEKTVKSIQLESIQIKINGHEAVDLGLSVKWATCNVGATKPSDYGNCYAWGETKTKSTYEWENSVTLGKSMKDIGGSQYDVAHTEWGSRWRMPTEDEFDELIDKCKWVWTTLEGYAGYKVTGPNGNSIFLPGADWRDGDSKDVVPYRGYWSSTPFDNDTALMLDFHVRRRMETIYRDCAGAVRPVAE